MEAVGIRIVRTTVCPLNYLGFEHLRDFLFSKFGSDYRIHGPRFSKLQLIHRSSHRRLYVKRSTASDKRAFALAKKIDLRSAAIHAWEGGGGKLQFQLGWTPLRKRLNIPA